MKLLILATCVGVIIVTAMNAAAHDGPHGGPTEATFTVSKSGDIKIGQNITVGAMVLRRAKYRFEHRLDGERHTVLLTSVDAKADTGRSYELPMRLFPGEGVAKRSAVYAKERADGSWGLTIVQVAGEAEEHVVDIQALAAR